MLGQNDCIKQYSVTIDYPNPKIGPKCRFTLEFKLLTWLDIVKLREQCKGLGTDCRVPDWIWPKINRISGKPDLTGNSCLVTNL